MTVDERLDRQSATARTGWRLARARPELLASTLRWLDEHPSGMPDVDAEWRRTLLGDGDFARWLESDEPRSTWTHPLPLRVLLSSHPFPDIHLWTMTRP